MPVWSNAGGHHRRQGPADVAEHGQRRLIEADDYAAAVAVAVHVEQPEMFVGMAQRCLELMCARLSTRVAFGRPVARYTVWHERIAEARCMIDQARLLTLDAAHKMDTVGNKAARGIIAMIKITAPVMACRVIDRAIQVHGALGITDDTLLSFWYRHERGARIYDGADEVHKSSVARRILKGYGYSKKNAGS